jgi:urease accessory protein
MFDGPASTWHASLSLRFRSDSIRTTVAHRHHGPLRMQKPLYPEGSELAHAVVLHPPGGIAGGDALRLEVRVDTGAKALITTPGATRWYKANGRSASQNITLAVDGALEWLPQEAIVFDAAQVDSTIDLALTPGARMLGWDIVALGRLASGERFERGDFRQRIRLSIGGEPIWIERTRIVGGDRLLESPIGLAGRHVFGCLWAAGVEWTDDEIAALRAELGAAAKEAPLTRLAPQLVVARTLAESTSAARATLETIWRCLRPRVMQRPAHAPRLWAT